MLRDSTGTCLGGTMFKIRALEALGIASFGPSGGRQALYYSICLSLTEVFKLGNIKHLATIEGVFNQACLVAVANLCSHGFGGRNLLGSRFSARLPRFLKVGGGSSFSMQIPAP